MAGETPITVVGNLTDDPELRFTPSGAAVANFTVASTPRTFDRQTQRVEGRRGAVPVCSVWRQAAENVAESLTSAACASSSQGRLKARSYETREGEKRTVFEIEVEEVGPSLKYATAKVTKTSRSGGGGGGGFQSGGGDDPWASNQRRRPAAASRPRSGGGSRRRPAGRRPAGRRPGRRPLGHVRRLRRPPGRAPVLTHHGWPRLRDHSD